MIRPLKVELAPNTAIRVTLEGCDGYFDLIWKDGKAVQIFAEMPDTKGREGLIYEERLRLPQESVTLDWKWVSNRDLIGSINNHRRYVITVDADKKGAVLRLARPSGETIGVLGARRSKKKSLDVMVSALKHMAEQHSGQVFGVREVSN